MCRKLVLLVCLSLVLVMVSPVLATKDWTNGGGDNLWSNTNNWSPAGVPAAGEEAVINERGDTDYCAVTSGVNALCGWLHIRNSTSAARLEVNSGATLTASGDVKIRVGGSGGGNAGILNISGDVDTPNIDVGWDGTGQTTVYSEEGLNVSWLAQVGGQSTGTLTIDGSSASAWIKHLNIAQNYGTGIIEVKNGGHLYVDDTMRLASNWDGNAGTGGTAIINLYDGLIEVGWQKKAACDDTQINIYDGLMKVGYGGFQLGADEVLDLHDGQFFFAGYGGEASVEDALQLVDDYILSGNIIGYGGTGTVVREWSSADWGVYISATPEPGTIALLGIGGLALLRRKK